MMWQVIRAPPPPRASPSSGPPCPSWAVPVLSRCRVCPTSASVLRYCPPGYFCPEGTGARNQNPCPAGTYTDDVQGLISLEQCRPCPVGHYCPFRATVFAVPCKPGPPHGKGVHREGWDGGGVSGRLVVTHLPTTLYSAPPPPRPHSALRCPQCQWGGGTAKTVK